MEDTLTATNEFNDWRDRVTWYTHETMVPRFIKLIGRPLFRLVMNLKRIDWENIPAGPCILAPNHINNFDALAIGLYFPRHPFYMTKKELFKNPVMNWIIRFCGAFPVDRGGRDAWTLRQAGHILKAGQMLCMFPEGTRSGRKAQLRQGKAGTVKLALEHKVPIVPAAILGTQYVKIGRKLPKVTLQIGEPIDVVALAGPPPYNTDTIRDLTMLLMQRIAAMLPPEHRGVYA